MVQIKPSVPGSVLSARVVYNSVEGEKKVPKWGTQPYLSKTVKLKKKKMSVYETNYLLHKKMLKGQFKEKMRMDVIKFQEKYEAFKMNPDMKKEKKQKRVKKVNFESENEVEGSTDHKRTRKRKRRNNKNKRIDTENDLIPSENTDNGNFCPVSVKAESSNNIDAAATLSSIKFKKMKFVKPNEVEEEVNEVEENPVKDCEKANKKTKIKAEPESNNIEDYDNFDISDSHSNEIDAAAILANIELEKMKFVKPKKVKKKTDEVENNQVTTNCEKASKKRKTKDRETEDKSMPLIENENTFNLNVDEVKPSGKQIHKDCSSSRKTTEEFNPKLKLKKGEVSGEKSHKKSVIFQADLTALNLELRESEDKKLNKRKIGNSAEEGKKKKKKKNKELQLELVSFKNDVLNKFLKSDLHEVEDSENLGAIVFGSIISPLTPKEFLNNYWEKSHLLIRGADKNRFQSILSAKDIDDILRENNLSYTKNIDITSYTEGKRETHNPEGRALASVVWDYYNSGCSVRLLNPQTFSKSVWKLLSTLQEFFNSFCGANVYLTPPGTQGFAPHWDDIEAFILQLEGKKRWKVYKWRSSKETLPRHSSGNFNHEDRLGELLLDCVLEPGDVLYFPRGYIHQAQALDDAHSLHITLSTYQKNSWVDLLEKLLPAALENAAAKHVEFRQGLPIEYMYNSGIAFADQNSELKDHLKEKITELVSKMIEAAPIDAAIDQLAKNFVYDSLPPYVTGTEKVRTVFEGGERWCGSAEGVVNRKELTPETPIRLLRKGCARLLVEENSVRLFHSVENSREYHEEEPKFIEISAELASGVEKLIHSYPEYVTVEDLPLSTLEDKMILATGLWEKGIIISENELEPSDLEELEK